jgi:hypothetical protein
MLLSWKEGRPDSATSQITIKKNPGACHRLQKNEWEAERAEFYMDSQTGLFVLQGNEID